MREKSPQLGSPDVIHLESYRTDWPDERFEQSMADVYRQTQQDRDWMRVANLPPYTNDREIHQAFMKGELVRFEPRPGIMPIQRLRDYDLSRSDPGHKYHYTPPYLRPEAAYVLRFIGDAWSGLQRERGMPYVFLSVTSMTRSSQYQASLRARPGRKIAIDKSNGDQSSHEFGYAFDIDACGLYYYDPGAQKLTSVNPRSSHWLEYADTVAAGREDLAGILSWLRERKILNPVEEVPESQEWCYHICVNPLLDAKQIVDSLSSKPEVL